MILAIEIVPKRNTCFNWLIVWLMTMNLEDVAKLAGVSRSTVSRVINDDPKVSKATRDLVWEVIRKENYQPNTAARTLVTRRTEIFGVVLPTSDGIFIADNSYFPRLLEGIGHALSDRGYGMLLWMGDGIKSHLIPRITNHHTVDGLIIVSLPENHPLYDALPNVRCPIVMIDKPLRYEEQISYISLDNVGGAQTATDYLIRLGYQRIAHITGILNIADGIDRLQGYKNALSAAGRTIDENLIAEGRFNRSSGYQAMKALLPHRPDAVFAASDAMAVGAYQAIQEAGLRIPQDIAVVGFDDADVAEQFTPTLTTIRQPVHQKGELAVAMLLELIETPSQSPKKVLIPYELIARNSCGGYNAI